MTSANSLGRISTDQRFKVYEIEFEKQDRSCHKYSIHKKEQFMDICF